MTHVSILYNQSKLEMLLPGDLSGTYDVRLRVNQDYVRPSRLMYLDCDYLAEAAIYQYPVDGDMVMLGTWDDCLCCTGGPRTRTSTDDVSVQNKNVFTIHDTNQHKMYYKARNISNDATKVTMKIGSSENYSNTYVDIYADSISVEPIATFDLQDYIPVGYEGWRTVYVTLDLNETLKAGTHDFYVVYRGHKSLKSDVTREYGITDSYWISFHNAETYKVSSPKIPSILE